MSTNRTEQDSLGIKDIPQNELWGIHTSRALHNFPLSTRLPDILLLKAYGMVKLAALTMCSELGCWKENESKQKAMIQAASELSEGKLAQYFPLTMLQGGAGTSLNMNVNEVLANRAIDILGEKPGSYNIVSPNDDINLYQSTNDTFPTALRLAAILEIQNLEQALVNLQEKFQEKEKEFSDIVKIARTQMQDAVLTTLGREMSAYAEALNRDRWRIYKCIERLRTVNLGGTAIGSGMAADRRYIFGVVEKLREISGVNLARSENLVEATQNCDVFVEVSGILKALASSLIKISNDLRFMSSGPNAGINEINLPPVQTGSSIMPGKVNPVIPEFVIQCAMQVCGNDSVISQAASSGTLELNPFLPLIASNLLENISLLTAASVQLADNCVYGITANKELCKKQILNSTAVLTALIQKTGYQKAVEISNNATQNGISVRESALSLKYITEEEFNELITPEAVCQLGFRKQINNKEEQ